MPTRKIERETESLYVARLAPLEYATARDAIPTVIDTVSYWPTIAEIKAAYRDERLRRRQGSGRLTLQRSHRPRAR